MASFAQDLLERRVPHVLAIYLGGSWGVIEFFAFLEDRFLLSPHLTNLVLVLLLILLPSVILFTYFHGRKGRDSWARTEKVFIPMNVAVALVVLFAGFSGKELGAVTTTVTLEDEQGNTVERVVPKREFRKRAAFFPLHVDTAGGTEAWLGEAVMHALTTDLFQEMFLDIREPPHFQEELREAGYAEGRGVPSGLKRQIAQELHLGYYVDGSVERVEGGFRVTTELHDADRARVLAERTFRGEDLFALVDSASVRLRRDLEIPTRHIEESPDVPVAEILTGSLEALRLFTEAMHRIRVAADYPGALEALDESVTVDSTFATGHFTRYQALLFSGSTAAATGAVRRAMDNSYRLPERLQFAVKAEWFTMQQDLARAFASYEMWAELYPQDITAQQTVAQIRLVQGDRPGAIDRLEHVLELDPTQMELVLRIGSLYEEIGEPGQARAYYEQYADANPEDNAAFVALAGLNRRQGDHDQARAFYDQALLLDPEDVELMVHVASLDRDVGAFDDAARGYARALDAARTPQQSYSAHMGFSRFHEYRGRFGPALTHLEQAIAAGRDFRPPIAQIQLQLVTLDTYVRAGEVDEALARLEALSAQLPPPLDAIVPIGQIGVYEALGQVDQLAGAVEAGQAMVERLHMNSLQQPVTWARGRLHELRGEWELAAAAYREERELDPTDPEIPTQLARCHRELGELERAESLALESLAARPSDAAAHLELARVYRAMDRPEDAVRHLEEALATWERADPGHRPAMEARELLAKLGSAAD